jgi:hypothetical protein
MGLFDTVKCNDPLPDLAHRVGREVWEAAIER